MKKSPITQIIVASLSFLCAVGVAWTQDAPAAESEQEVVTLSEFTVTTSADDGYGASMTATGSRVAEQIKNLPYTVEVITSEMLDDLGFDDLDEDFAYASSFGGYDSDGGGANLRGMRVGKELRNGFLRIGVTARSNIDRIEIIKGPSAAVYGECLPAGLINVITRAPKSKPGYEVATRFASRGFFSTRAEATGPIGSRTAYILNTSYMSKGFNQPFAHQRSKSFSGAVEHKFSKNTRLLVEAEQVERKLTPTASVPAKRIGTGTNANPYRYVGLAMEVAGFNYYGPAELSTRKMTTYNTTFEHRFNRVWSFRAAGNWFKRRVDLFKNVDGGGGTRPIYNAETGMIISRFPARGRSEEDGHGIQADLLAHYRTGNGKFEHRTLFTVDYSSYSRLNWQVQPSTNGNATATGFALQMDPKNPNYFWPAPEDFPSRFKLDRYTDGTTDVVGAFMRHQTAMWDGRLIVVGGLRYDYVMEDLRNETRIRLGTSDKVSVKKHNEGHFTPNFGVNFELISGVRGYVNFARSFFVDAQSNSAPEDPDAERDLENENGYGIDYGIKVSTFKDRLKFSLGGFYIMRKHMRMTDEFEESRRIGGVRSRGLEFDASFRTETRVGITILKFGYGYTDAKYAEAGRDLQRVGRPMSGIPEHNAYLAFNQQWKRGILKGFRVSFGVIYTGSSYPWSDNGGIKDPDGFMRGQSGYADIKVPDYFSTRAGIGYEFRTGKLRHEINISMTNLLDDDCVQRNRKVMEPFSIGGQYRLRF